MVRDTRHKTDQPFAEWDATALLKLMGDFLEQCV